MSRSYDVVVVGGGHNGLTTAAYLAKAGRSVLVLERRHILGGACVSEQIYPGFTYSVCSYVVSLLRPEVIHELGLAQHGLQIIPLEGSFTPMENGDYLAFWPDEGDTREEIKRHSIRDADRYNEFDELMYEMAYAVKPILGMVPPDLVSPSLRDLGTLRDLAKHVKGLDKRKFHYLTKIMTMSAADFLEEWFETDVLRASIAINGIIGTMLGPQSPGTAYVLLHHYMGELDGAFTAWGSQKGGTGGVSEALASAARSFGAETRCSAPVDHVIVKNGRAQGVVLENGDEIEARIVVSGCDPRVTFEKLVSSRDLPDDLVSSIKKFKFRGSSGKVNLALDGLPEFTAAPDSSVLDGMAEISPTMEFMERAYDEAKYGWYSSRPYMDVVVPTVRDPSMAPPGKHVLSLFVQYANYDLEKSNWEDERENFGDVVVDTICEFAPNVRDMILHRQVLTPWDLEKEFGLTQGNIFHGELTLDQLFFMRPAVGWAQFRTPIRNYYQCGSGAHPGGGITGGPGRLAALEILRNER
jgi:phytoene dehydrogenase-like protein